MKPSTLYTAGIALLLVVGGIILFTKSTPTPTPSNAPAEAVATSSAPAQAVATPTAATSTKKAAAPTATPSSTTKSTATPHATSITIKDYTFSPATLTIKKGTTVTWTNEDIAKHTVTGDQGGPSSEFFGKGQSYSYTFSTAGTFSYHCEPHPYMTATIVVTE